MDFGERLDTLLKAADISQYHLSKELHISPSTLNGYVKNKRQPEYKTLLRMAAYFGTSTDFLLGYTPQTQDTTPLSADESLLLEMYRLMTPQGQTLLIEEAKLLWKFHKQPGEPLPESDISENA